MKIQQLLGTVQLLLKERRMNIKAPYLPTEKGGDWFEFYSSLDKLNRIFTECDLEQEATAETLQPFVKFLQERWKLVGDYPNNTFQSTPLCFALADAIAGVVGVNRYALLMPTVDLTPSTLTTTDFRGDAFQIHQFILGDKKEIIEVYDCLESSEHDEGVLKHTHLFSDVLVDGQASGIRNLSSAEAQRVINYSPETKDYYKKIQEQVKVKKHGMSIGAFINRLIDDLHAGSIAGTQDRQERNRRELIAATEANLGIARFCQFLESLECCSIEISLGIPATNTKKPNTYFLSKENNSWKLTYIDKNAEPTTIPVTDITIDQFRWDAKQQKSVKKVIKLTSVLKSLSDRQPAIKIQAAKLRIIELIKSWHYGKRLDDGTELADLYGRGAPGSFNLKYYCDRLANPHVMDGDTDLNSSYCVKLISGSIKSILDNNKDLFDKFPKYKTSTDAQGIENIELSVKYAREKLEAALKQSNFVPAIHLSMEQSVDIRHRLFAECGEQNSLQFKEKLKELILSNHAFDASIMARKITDQKQVTFIKTVDESTYTFLLIELSRVNPTLILPIVTDPNCTLKPDILYSLAKFNNSIALRIIENPALVTGISDEKILSLALQFADIATKLISDSKLNINLRGKQLHELIKKHGENVKALISNSAALQIKINAYNLILQRIATETSDPAIEFFMKEAEVSSSDLREMATENHQQCLFILKNHPQNIVFNKNLLSYFISRHGIEVFKMIMNDYMLLKYFHPDNKSTLLEKKNIRAIVLYRMAKENDFELKPELYAAIFFEAALLGYKPAIIELQKLGASHSFDISALAREADNINVRKSELEIFTDIMNDRGYFKSNLERKIGDVLIGDYSSDSELLSSIKKEADGYSAIRQGHRSPLSLAGLFAAPRTRTDCEANMFLEIIAQLKVSEIIYGTQHFLEDALKHNPSFQTLNAAWNRPIEEKLPPRLQKALR